jgi:hypothetical protein
MSCIKRVAVVLAFGFLAALIKKLTKAANDTLKRANVRHAQPLLLLVHASAVVVRPTS